MVPTSKSRMAAARGRTIACNGSAPCGRHSRFTSWNHGSRPSGKWRNANAVPMIQKFPQNTPVAPSYGRSVFLSVRSLPTKPLPKWRNGPRRPPKRPYPAPQGHMGPHAGRVHWVCIDHANKFCRWTSRPEQPPRVGRSSFGIFRPLSGPERSRKISPSLPWIYESYVR